MPLRLPAAGPSGPQQRAPHPPPYVFGGPTIVGELARRDLTDEYQLFAHPVALGGDAPLFPALGDRQQVESRVYDGTVISMRHARQR